MEQNSRQRKGGKEDTLCAAHLPCRGARFCFARWHCPSTGCGRWLPPPLLQRPAYVLGQKLFRPRTVLVDAPAAVYATGAQEVDSCCKRPRGMWTPLPA